MAIIYLAAGLFNAAERLHNLFLEKELKKLGHEVILPQREALKHFNGKQFDTVAIVEDCTKSSANPAYVIVVCVDGARADDGAAVEYGMAITATGRAVVYRTDFRTAPKKELGLNAMFKAKGTIFIYYPCFFTEIDEVCGYYKKLALKIHKAICKLGLAEG